MIYTPLERPESIPTVFVEAWNRRDPDTIASLFDEDAEFVNVTGLWWHTREAIRKAHAYGLTRIFQHSTLRLGVVRVKRLSDDIAVVHARMRLEGQTPVADVEHPQPRSTIFSFVVHRVGAEWRCASAQNTDIVPNMETNIIADEGWFGSVDYSQDSARSHMRKETLHRALGIAATEQPPPDDETVARWREEQLSEKYNHDTD